jgi:hypothetical protein
MFKEVRPKKNSYQKNYNITIVQKLCLSEFILHDVKPISLKFVT